MKTKKILTILVLALAIMVCSARVSEAAEMGTAFTYQGRLMDKNKPADGLYDFQFKLYDRNDPCTGVQLGSPIDINDLDVIDGHFVVELDFGSGIFDGNAVWLETRVVESPLGSDPVILSPLLELTPTPYALYAETAGGVPGGTVGSGTTNYIAKFTGPNTIGNSAVIYESADKVTISGVSTNAPLLRIVDSDTDTGYDALQVEGETTLQAVGIDRLPLIVINTSGEALRTLGDLNVLYGNASVEGDILVDGNVGIGTTSPSEKLEVNGTVKATAFVGDGSGLTGLLGDSDWIISDSNMYSGVSGNVGLGTTNPEVKLDVITSNVNAVRGESSHSGGRGVYGVASNSGSMSRNYGGSFWANGGRGRAVYGGAYNSGSVVNYGGYFTASGSEGRGVYGTTSGSEGRGVCGFASNRGDYVNYGGHFVAYGQGGRGVYGYAPKSGNVSNYGGYFKAAGNTGRGVYGEAPRGGVWGKATGYGGFGVYGFASNRGDYVNYGGYFVAKGQRGGGVYGEASGSSGRGVYGYATNNGNTENYGGYFTAAGATGRGVFGYAPGSSAQGVYGYAPGKSGVGVYGWGYNYDFWAGGPGTNYGHASSIRWKSDIRAIDDPLGKIVRLRAVYFNWDEEHGGHYDVGMIAEEVGEVLPEIVKYETDGKYTSGMDYSKLTPLLVEAVKALKIEADERQKALAKRDVEIAALKDRLSTVETMMVKLTRWQEGGIQ